MDANDDEATVLVAITPAPDVRECSRTVESGVGPEIDQHDVPFDTVADIIHSGTSFFGSKRSTNDCSTPDVLASESGVNSPDLVPGRSSLACNDRGARRVESRSPLLRIS